MEQTQPKRITYLFGAGASIGNGKLLNDEKPSGIPVVEKFNEDIDIFLEQISNNDLVDSNDECERHFGNIKTQLKQVYRKFSSMYSFDTYAKSLFEKRQLAELSELKLLLKAYIIYRQTVCSPDPRYDLLFATLINNKSIPSHVNFLSWNYDTQVEISLSKFSTLKSDKFLEFIQLGHGEINSYKSSLLKLNGTVSINKEWTKFECCEQVDDGCFEDDSLIQNAIKNIIRCCNTENMVNNTPQMYFSWEEKDRFNKVINHSKEIVTKTDILIIIGYSFPTLNREADKWLLEHLASYAQIHVQCSGENDFNVIKSKIESLAPKYKARVDSGTSSLIPSRVNYVAQNKEFYVPFEFDYN